MKKNRKIIIGVILEDIHTDFSKELIKSIVNAIPPGKNVRLAVLPGKYDSVPELHEYHEVHNSVFALGEQCGFDGLIIHLGGLDEDLSAPPHRRIKNFGDIPTVYIGLDRSDIVTVNYDNETGIREAVNYLVNVSGITRLCMLGGREDNKDARLRKTIFMRCLEEYGLDYNDRFFVNTDMSIDCAADAERLLDMNPDAQAVFCVNDASAKGLYSAMAKKGLIPGKDLLVFAFDNTNMSGELSPALSSIGAYGTTLGGKALDLVLDMINGAEVGSALVPTRLYGRDSLPYAMYDYNVIEMMNIEPAFIYRMFDDCFYRYRTSQRGREQIDLRRLYFEMISRILYAVKYRYLGIETFKEITRMIDIFFCNDAVNYTDAAKLMESIGMLQQALNDVQRSQAAGTLVNRLFLRMRDRAITAFADKLSEEKKQRFEETRLLQLFMAESMSFSGEPAQARRDLIRSLECFCMKNAALYLFDEPFTYARGSFKSFPQTLKLICVVRKGEVHLVPEVRQRCPLRDMFRKSDMPSDKGGFIAFPIFHRDIIYGLLLSEPCGDIYERGECVALQIGMAMYLTNKDNNR